MILLGIISVSVYPIGLNLFVPGSEFNLSIGVFIILMIGILSGSIYKPFSGILLQGGQPAMNTYMVGTLVLFQIALNIALIPVIGIYGAALASALTFIIEAGLIRLFSVKLFGLRL